MKAVIGNYTTWVGPYQIAEKVLFWMDKCNDDRVHAFGKWLAGPDDKKTALNSFCEWIHSFKKRKIKVKLDYWDAWNVDSTLTPIILPLLKELKTTKQGSGYIDLVDVPEHLRYTETEPFDNQRCFDFYADAEKLPVDIHTRYEWVLNEMIWTFEQLEAGDWEDQYWSVRPELDMSDHPEDTGLCKPLRWAVEGECDWDGMRKHQSRIDSGVRLFGKYFQTLWS